MNLYFQEKIHDMGKKICTAKKSIQDTKKYKIQDTKYIQKLHELNGTE